VNFSIFLIRRYEDGEEIELSDEEYETLGFLDVLV